MSGLHDPDRTLLLTGGTSALGWAVARRLAVAGHGVLLAVRKPARRGARERIAAFRGEDPEAAGRLRLVNCDLGADPIFDERGLARITADCTGVVHIAADRRPDVPREALFDVNVGATRRLLELARTLERGQRFVHVSDTSISGTATGVWMEDQLLAGQDFGGDPVGESRMLAERHVRRAMPKIPATVVRTVLPVARRERPDPVIATLQRLRALARLPLPSLLKRVPVVAGPARRVHALSVDTVADVIVAAVDDEETAGQTLHVADPFAPSLAEWLAHVSVVLGLAPPGPRGPGPSLLPAGFPAADVVYDTTHTDALLRRAGIVRPSWREGIEVLVGSVGSG